MGWGDEIIAAGQARKLHAQNGRKVIIRDRNGAARWSEIWANNPRIAKPGEHVANPVWLTNGPGLRPYIAVKTERQWHWRDFDCPVGEIHFHDYERNFAAGFDRLVVIEPTLKSKASPNKDWGRERWMVLAALLRREGVEPVQLGSKGTQVLPGARLIETPSFRHGCAVLSRARLAILPEGGLHHAAAALGIPAVVIFGGFISPKQTGYASQRNLFTGGAPCGMRVPCDHCKKAMEAITPEEVAREALELLHV